MKTEQERAEEAFLLIEKLGGISPRVKAMLEPIKKLPLEYQEVALAMLYKRVVEVNYE